MIPIRFRTWLFYWGPSLIWMALIFYGSSIPGGAADTMTREASGVEEPAQIQRIKDVVHLLEYGLLALLLVRSFRKGASELSAGHAVKSFAIATVYGIADEMHQLFIPFRSGNVGDVLRDAVGAGLAVLIVVGIGKIRGSGLGIRG